MSQLRSSVFVTPLLGTACRLDHNTYRSFGMSSKATWGKAMPTQGDRLVLKASWTKGGKAREIPIRTDEQRAVLKKAHEVAGRGSLIAPERTYVQQLRIYERQTANAGLSKFRWV